MPCEEIDCPYAVDGLLVWVIFFLSSFPSTTSQQVNADDP